MIHPQRILRRPGIVLVEALVAISTLAMGVIALGTITQNAIGTTVLAKDYLVARGLAKEGEEAVKSIRYTNWMLKPSDDSCWLRILPSNDQATGDPSCNNTASVGNNYVAYLKNGIWVMASYGNMALDLNTVSSSNALFGMKFDGNAYYYPIQGNTSTATPKFYRSVKFTNVDDATKNYASATFTVKVQWKDGAKTQEVNRILTMYNYR